MGTPLGKFLLQKWRSQTSKSAGPPIEQESQLDSERSYAALVEALPQIVWTSRPNGEIDFANSRWYDFTGLTPEQTMGTGWTKVVHPDDLEITLREWTKALQTGQPVEVMYRVRHVDGSFRWVLGRGVPIREGDRIVKWFGSLTDIEERKQAEEVLREEDRRKDEFLATLAHELRNPLAPIRNMVEVIKQQDNSGPVVQDAVSVMDRQLKQMVRLIDDLLDVTHIRKGRFTLRMETVNLEAVISQAVEASRPQMERFQHRLMISQPEEPIYLLGDAARLAQVFGNVLNNASKYTPPHGQITLSVVRHTNSVVVSVKDNGRGIAPEMHDRIFQMFAQGDSPSNDSPGGLGIGLTLARKFVELHRGRIEARSEGLNRGSELIVELPVSAIPIANTSISAVMPSVASPLRILVIDDNRDSAESFTAFLVGLRHQVRTTFDGPAALRLAQEFRPQVIFCDLAMPGMSGTEVAVCLRKQMPDSRAQLIALTGYGSESDHQRTIQAGFDRHLVKPIDLTMLAEVLAAVARESEISSSATSAEPAVAASPQP